MARPNFRGRQVVSFRVTGKRFAAQFGLPDYVRGIVKRYEDAKVAAVQVVSERAPGMALERVSQAYTIAPGYLANRVHTANTPDTFRLFASSLRYPLALFGGGWGGMDSPGASAAIVRGQSHTYQGAFMAPGRFRGAPTQLIYTRLRGQKVRMTYGRYKGKVRERIRNLRGPSVYSMILGRDATGARSYIDLATPLAADLRQIFLAELAKSYGQLSDSNV